MSNTHQTLYTRLAASPDDLRAAQELRYHVFVEEMGGDGAGVNHAARQESDWFDDFADQLLLCDTTRAPANQVVGVYRLMTQHHAANAGRFYSEAEFDLTELKSCGRNLLELGRSCLHPDYRGGPSLFHLWRGLAGYVMENDIDLLFGVASFAGTDVAAHRQSLAYLHRLHLADPATRPVATGKGAVSMERCDVARFDHKSAILGLPSLIKSYLRLGATIGQGAYVDNAFNTIDVCIVLDAKAIGATTSIMIDRLAR